MIEQHLAAASSYASDIDFVITLIAVLVGVPFLICEAILIGFALKYKAKDGQKAMYVTGKEKKYKRFITWPHALILVFDVIIVIFAVRVWVNVKQNLPEPDATVRIIAQQWAWTFVQPGPDGKLDTDDDITTNDALHVEVGKTYNYELTSTDVLHDFSVPVFRLKQDAIPGRVIKGWFKPTQTGEWDIQCAEICGIGHGIMAARIHIESAKDHAAWQASMKPAAAAPAAAAPADAQKPAEAAPADAQKPADAKPAGAAPTP